MRQLDRWTGALVVLICAGAYLVTLTYPAGAARFPQLVILFTAALAGTLCIQSVISPYPPRMLDRTALRAATPRVLFMIGASAAYIFLLDAIGYFPATLVYAIAAMRGLGLRRWPIILLSSGLFLIVVTVIFLWWLKIPLPEGRLF